MAEASEAANELGEAIPNSERTVFEVLADCEHPFHDSQEYGPLDSSTFPEGKTRPPEDEATGYGRDVVIVPILLDIRKENRDDFLTIIHLMAKSPEEALAHSKLSIFWSRFPGITPEEIQTIGRRLVEGEPDRTKREGGVDNEEGELPPEYDEFENDLLILIVSEDREALNKLLGLMEKAIDGLDLSEDECNQLPGQNLGYLKRIRKNVTTQLAEEDEED